MFILYVNQIQNFYKLTQIAAKNQAKQPYIDYYECIWFVHFLTQSLILKMIF